jgi:hypothetical protein
MNTVQCACLRSLERGDWLITPADLEDGIKKELAKEGKIM